MTLDSLKCKAIGSLGAFPSVVFECLPPIVCWDWTLLVLCNSNRILRYMAVRELEQTFSVSSHNGVRPWNALLAST